MRITVGKGSDLLCDVPCAAYTAHAHLAAAGAFLTGDDIAVRIGESPLRISAEFSAADAAMQFFMAACRRAFVRLRRSGADTAVAEAAAGAGPVVPSRVPLIAVRGAASFDFLLTTLDLTFFPVLFCVRTFGRPVTRRLRGCPLFILALYAPLDGLPGLFTGGCVLDKFESVILQYFMLAVFANLTMLLCVFLNRLNRPFVLLCLCDRLAAFQAEFITLRFIFA